MINLMLWIFHAINLLVVNLPYDEFTDVEFITGLTVTKQPIVSSHIQFVQNSNSAEEPFDQLKENKSM